MVSVAIDGVEIAAVTPQSIAINLTANTMRSVEESAKSSDITIAIEVEATNIEAQLIFSGEGALHDGVGFNKTEHHGEIRLDGEPMFSGSVALLSTIVEGDKVTHTLRVRRNGAEWATGAMERLIHEVELEYFEQLNIVTMEGSWSDDSFIKFLPVHRDSYSSTYSSSSLDTVQRIRSVDDYHPFINLYALLMKIFEEDGYTVESSFLESDEFKKLYMSGAYTSQDSAEAKQNMDFYVVKMADVSTTVDYRGRVSMSPLDYFNTVGYMVDFESIDAYAECYSLGGCFTIKDSSLIFTPTQAVTVGFEIRLLYSCDYTIKSRTALKTIDTLYFDGSMIYDYGVANTLLDQRDEPIEMLFEYKVVIFDGSSSQKYQLSLMINGVETFLDSWVGTSGEVTTPRFSDSDSVGSPKLYAVSSSGVRTQYYEDWALYMGYVDLEGSVDVDVTVRTPPRAASPSSPVQVTGPFVSGGSLGMNFTLKANTSLQPFFASCPGFGSYVEFSDLAQHEFRAESVVEAVRHLFNLAIYSDLESKKVYIEPTEQIYNSQVVWDWSERIIENQPITFTDIAVEGSRARKWGYQQSDGVTTRISGFYYEPGETYPDAPTAEPEQSVDGAYSPEYGSWVVPIESYVAEQRTQSELNPIFSPTINDTLGLPIVGDRDNPDMVDTLEFSPRILSMEGMMYSDNELIPKALFFSEDEGVNLCFEDREGLDGLNKYYREKVKREESGRYVELSLRLTPNELIALYTPSDQRPHILSTFALTIAGERCEARIESIEMTAGEVEKSYHVAKCMFLIIK